MRVYEVTIKLSIKDKSDKIRWIVASSKKAVREICKEYGLKIGKIKITKLDEHDCGVELKYRNRYINVYKLYINMYSHCNIDWEDEWDCKCNDDCPVCGEEIEPKESIEII